MFIAGLLGVEGNVYTDASFISGSSTTYGNGSIVQSTGASFDIILGSATGDDFTVDTNTLVVESDNNRVGIGTTTPSTPLHIDSNAANTSPIITIENIAGNVQLFCR